MSIITDLKRRIRKNDERISKIVEANAELRQELAEMSCPYELGDKREAYVIISIRPMNDDGATIPINPATRSPYFEIPEESFGTGWTSGDVTHLYLM